jgi:hypothetical protein
LQLGWSSTTQAVRCRSVGTPRRRRAAARIPSDYSPVFPGYPPGPRLQPGAAAYGALAFHVKARHAARPRPTRHWPGNRQAGPDRRAGDSRMAVPRCPARVAWGVDGSARTGSHLSAGALRMPGQERSWKAKPESFRGGSAASPPQTHQPPPGGRPWPVARPAQRSPDRHPALSPPLPRARAGRFATSPRLGHVAPGHASPPWAPPGLSRGRAAGEN